jgi:hypothetical protein
MWPSNAAATGREDRGAAYRAGLASRGVGAQLSGESSWVADARDLSVGVAGSAAGVAPGFAGAGSVIVTVVP